jgi:hypothetical protein
MASERIEPVKPPEMGFWESIADSITGSRRATPETRSLPEYTGMPELNRMSMASFKSGVGTLMSSPEETVKVLKSNFPGMQVRQDSKGNYILRSSINNREYAIPPGFSVGDIPRALAGVASVVPAGLATTIPRAAAVAAGNQAAIEASQAMTGGSFDPEDVAIAGVIGGSIPAVGSGAKKTIQAASRALRRAERFNPMQVPEIPKVKESRYETAQEGPFFRVKPRSAQAAGSKDRGIREEVRQADAAPGSGGGDVPQPVSDEAIGLLIKDPSNFVRRTAEDYSQRASGHGYQLPDMPESSLAKQSAIGRTFQLAADGDDAYKRTIFEAYGRRYPELVEATGAKNYDQLLEASYRQLAKETADQFHALPVNMSYHRAGEGNYQSSGEMLRDVYGNRHLYVYQGGDPHDFLNALDPETGLNTNEMFRAIHDFYGHAVHGNTFGPKGEEIAYGAHAQMFSPLARMAMASETRGQNSFVNYTPVNAELKQRINRLNEARYEANRRGQTADVAEIDKLLGEAWQGFQFAPQKSVLLPPEFVDTAYTGGMPGYIQSLIRPEPGTTASEMLTHFSHSPDLQMLDPTRYGTGIKGREMERLLGTQNPVMERSYAYTGDPSRVRPEPGLGRFRYGARSEGLYDVADDPLLFRTLAAEANRTPFTAKYNRGMTDPDQSFTDIERMAKEYGYEGLMNPQQGTAILYRPTPVQPFQAGGAVKPVKEGLKKGIKGALEAVEPMVNRISMSFKDVTKRVPELTEAAQAVSRGDMSADEYDRLVRRYKPVTPYEFVPEPASADDAMRALTENKRPMFGKTSEMSPGERADLRLDIPAYKDHGVWVNSIHRKDAPTVYGSVSSVKNATMIGSPEKAMKVATGETPKAPFAVIRGDWNPMTEGEAVKAAKQYLNHPEWRQVGYDPERHGYFYDRATMEPILGAEEVIQIGPLVLARKPQFGKKSEQKYQSGGLARARRRK